MNQEDDGVNTSQAVKDANLSWYEQRMQEHAALVAYINAATTPEERNRRKMHLHGAMYSGEIAELTQLRRKS